MVIIFIQTHFYSIVSLETHINTRFVQTGFPHMFPSKHLVIFKILLFVLPIFESFALFLITHDHNINSDSFLLNSFSWNRHHHKIYSNWFCPHVSLKTLGHIKNTVVGFAFIYFCKFCLFPYYTWSYYLYFLLRSVSWNTHYQKICSVMFPNTFHS